MSRDEQQKSNLLKDYQRIEKLLRYIETHAEDQPDLEELAKEVNLNTFHLQKLFKSWAGVSPKQYLKLATLTRAKKYLLEDISILEASYQSGLSSSSRLYDHFVSIDAVTPGEYKLGGSGLSIDYGFAASVYGNMFVAWTDKGVHQLVFSENPDKDADKLNSEWPNAKLKKNQKQAIDLVNSLSSFSTNIFTSNTNAGKHKSNNKINLHLKGTNFQIQVWKALLSIPAGVCVSYGDLAHLLGKPKAARAVGAAVGANSLALLIPCHRVIQSSGVIGEYRWGAERKRLILAREACLKEG